MKLFRILFYFLLSLMFSCSFSKDVETKIVLNGTWEFGSNREYVKTVQVPGLVNDPSKINDEKIWYKKTIFLPEGNWNFATLELKGARFLPEVYVNGEIVSFSEGGMAPTFHVINRQDFKPGKEVVLEIALSGLTDVPHTDASYIPAADHWRSNVSSCLWDDVVLHFHKNLRIESVIPFIDQDNSSALLDIYTMAKDSIFQNTANIEVSIIDEKGKVMFNAESYLEYPKSRIELPHLSNLEKWSPLSPSLYKAKIEIFNNKRELLDVYEMNFANKLFEIRDKKFYLNGELCEVRAGTIVWHRWVRDKEGVELGWDEEWFLNNVIKPLKNRGANTVRFHLGNPPERFLDLCDKHGMIVQYEWSFFHGMPASFESLTVQYEKWLDLAMKHPSVSLIHPYNETYGDQLTTVWNALDTLFPKYPKLVLEERDVIHVHKYWYSLFENLGLYYDSYQDFPKAIMVDEFGGNYLDGKYDMGGYSTLRQSYLRFLGRNHTRELRKEHHTLSNAKIAEYWRRIGAAGFSPFCILGSWEDGNHWYEGKLEEGKLKPVWNALTAAYSPVSLSMDIWDRNFLPGQEIEIPLHLFNMMDESRELKFKLMVYRENTLVFSKLHTVSVDNYSHIIKNYKITMPDKTGHYKIIAELINPPDFITEKVQSVWSVRVFSPIVPKSVEDMKIAVYKEDKELKTLFDELNISMDNYDKADIFILGEQAMDNIRTGDKDLLKIAESVIDNNKDVIWLDAGDFFLGAGYPGERKELGNLQGSEVLTDLNENTYKFVKGIELTFSNVAESESNIQYPLKDSSLWWSLDKQHAWMWNGLRGGLIVPAVEMSFSGLSCKAFLEEWQSKGAIASSIENGSYFAYELQGFYEFSEKEDDKEIKKKLRDKVKFLIEDAPALAISINPGAPIIIHDLGNRYNKSKSGQAKNFIPLVNAGKDLTRVPVTQIDFGKNKGDLIISQLITAGRLNKSNMESGIDNKRYDPVTVQFIINMIKKLNDE